MNRAPALAARVVPAPGAAALRFKPTPPLIWLALALLLAAAGATIVLAMLRMSTTFDEIVMIAGGARGYQTGEWSIAPEHPPLVQYMYGLPVFLAGVNYPDEAGVPAQVRTAFGYRYQYAQSFFWQSGNDPETIAALGRLPAVLCALGLILLVFLYTRQLAGAEAALLAAGLTATLPDLLAHGGVAYNDVPLALVFLAAIWAIDSALRSPTPLRALRAGVIIGVALALKNSAIALGPVALLLLVCEATVRRREPGWWRGVALSSIVVVAGTYAALVLAYRGDILLTEYRYAVGFAILHVTGMNVPAFLLGSVSLTGWWYFFPVAFLYKTSAGLHMLMAIAVAGWVRRFQARTGPLLASPVRAPLVGMVVFGGLLLRSQLNIGFRYALPLLPLLCILVAVGIAGLWRTARPLIRGTVVVALLWLTFNVGSYYPYFISYISEYGPDHRLNHTVLVDSSLDWGQGLLELRNFMRTHSITSVYLSYFGSALPAGYGIRYVPLASFIPLPSQPPFEPEPQWVAISATNLSGTYFTNDPFAQFRSIRPDHVVANTIFLYRIPESP